MGVRTLSDFKEIEIRSKMITDYILNMDDGNRLILITDSKKDDSITLVHDNYDVLSQLSSILTDIQYKDWNLQSLRFLLENSAKIINMLNDYEKEKELRKNFSIVEESYKNLQMAKKLVEGS